MKRAMQILRWSALGLGLTLLAEGCAVGVGVGPDYYGPAYGGEVRFGHPYYGDHFWGGPGGRRWR